MEEKEGRKGHSLGYRQQKGEGRKMSRKRWERDGKLGKHVHKSKGKQKHVRENMH